MSHADLTDAIAQVAGADPATAGRYATLVEGAGVPGFADQIIRLAAAGELAGEPAPDVITGFAVARYIPAGYDSEQDCLHALMIAAVVAYAATLEAAGTPRGQAVADTLNTIGEHLADVPAALTRPAR
jgi:hypothetical protein